MKEKINIIVDLDGTISFDDHRRKLIPDEGWDAYFAACVNDEPNLRLIEVMRVFVIQGFKLHILTGRAECTMEATFKWLDHHDVPYHNLMMRRNEDYDSTSRDSDPDNFRSDEDVKNEMLINAGLNVDNVLVVLDDRDVMLKFWRESGYMAWQVRPEGKLY